MIPFTLKCKSLSFKTLQHDAIRFPTSSTTTGRFETPVHVLQQAYPFPVLHPFENLKRWFDLISRVSRQGCGLELLNNTKYVLYTDLLEKLFYVFENFRSGSTTLSRNFCQVVSHGISRYSVKFTAVSARERFPSVSSAFRNYTIYACSRYYSRSFKLDSQTMCSFFSASFSFLDVRGRGA